MIHILHKILYIRVIYGNVQKIATFHILQYIYHEHIINVFIYPKI